MKSDVSYADPLEYNLATRNAAGDIVARVADLFPKRAAIVDCESHHTYEQLNLHAEAIAQKLVGIHRERTKPIALIMGNSYDFLTAYFGILKAGLTVMPINHSLTADDVQWILNDAEAASIIADSDFLHLFQSATEQPLPNPTTLIVRQTGGQTADASVSAPAEANGTTSAVLDFHDIQQTEVREPLRIMIDDRDTAQCLYTSGTTSRPKGALAAHAAVVTAAGSNARMLQVSWDRGPTKLLSVLPMYHVTALNTLILPVLSHGGTVVLHGPFNPTECLKLIEKHSIDIVMALPMMFGALVQANAQVKADATSVRQAIYGMAQMPDSVMAGLQSLMPNAEIYLGSGQTEVLPATVNQWGVQNPEKTASWGMPTPTVQVAIMSPDGRLLPRGEEGEIVYRGPNVTLGYWNNPQANAAAFAHGWFHSGDIGYQDEDGTVWFTDRAKDIIKTGGENVSSLKVEQVLMDAPGVDEVTVIATPDEHWGQAVTAVVKSSLAASDDDPAAPEVEQHIIAYARDRLAGFETPKLVRFVSELPRTSTGKIQKHILRDSLS